MRKRNAIEKIRILLNEIKIALFCRFKKKTLNTFLLKFQHRFCYQTTIAFNVRIFFIPALYVLK